MSTNYFFLILFQGALFVIAVMLATWLLSLRLRNASIVDFVWAGTFAILALLYAALGDGYLPRRVLMLVMISFWSLRLARYLFRRIWDQHPAEDPRYARLRKEWGARVDYKFLLFSNSRDCSLWLFQFRSHSSP